MKSAEGNSTTSGSLALCSNTPFHFSVESHFIGSLGSYTAGASSFDASIFQDKRIILAEDSKTCQLLMIAMLGAEELCIDVANNGNEVVARCLEEPYDLILMDYHMPLMGGIEATREIRQHEVDTGREPAVIVAVTADIQGYIQEECLAVGMNDFITKPYKRKELFEILEKWL